MDPSKWGAVGGDKAPGAGRSGSYRALRATGVDIQWETEQGRLAQLRSCKKVSTGHGIKTRRTGEGAQTGRPAELPCLVMGPVGLQSVRRFEVEAFFEDRVKGIH